MCNGLDQPKPASKHYKLQKYIYCLGKWKRTKTFFSFLSMFSIKPCCFHFHIKNMITLIDYLPWH